MVAFRHYYDAVILTRAKPRFIPHMGLTINDHTNNDCYWQSEYQIDLNMAANR